MGDRYAGGCVRELEPEWLAGMTRAVFDWTCADGGKRERYAQALCRARRGSRAVSSLHAGQPGRGDRDGQRHGGAQHSASGGASLDVDDHTLAQFQQSMVFSPVPESLE
jgi:hypothetical protein